MWCRCPYHGSRGYIQGPYVMRLLRALPNEDVAEASKDVGRFPSDHLQSCDCTVDWLFLAKQDRHHHEDDCSSMQATPTQWTGIKDWYYVH